jgi:uncharacterized protein YbaR (Trm112 family)
MGHLDRLLEILACPQCKGELQLADEAIVGELNRQLKDQVNKDQVSKEPSNSIGSGPTRSPSKKPAEAALLCKRCGLAFPVIEGIPNMVLAEAISWPAAEQGK